jgi:hypothetical protein
MEIKVFDKIEKHDEFDEDYCNELHSCLSHITEKEQKLGYYCSAKCTNNCYEKQKLYFEQYVCEIRNPQTVYIKRIGYDNFTYVKSGELKSRYPRNKWFVSKWLADKHLTFLQLDFYPDE